MHNITAFLKPAAGACTDLAYEFDLDPQELSTATLTSFDLMINDIVKQGDITQKKLAEALETDLVGHGMLAITVRDYDFGKLIDH